MGTASFGGVAALFGDDEGLGTTTDPSKIDKAATQPKSHAAKSSFGGVASLFSPNDAEETAPVPNSIPQTQHTQQQNTQPLNPPQQQSGQKTRTQSFGGVAGLFQGMADDDDQRPIKSQQ